MPVIDEKNIVPNKIVKKVCPVKSVLIKRKALDREVGKDHLLGYKDNCTDVIGLYPLLEDDTCKLIVFDFDNHDNKNSENNDWKDEIDAIRKICHENGIDVLIERSMFRKWGTCMDSLRNLYLPLLLENLDYYSLRKDLNLLISNHLDIMIVCFLLKIIVKV